MPRGEDSPYGPYIGHGKTAPPVAYDGNGWPIFAYNDKWVPISCSNKRKGRGMCMNIIRFPNGRCKLHGGPSPRGFQSATVRAGIYGGKMNKSAAKILIDSVNDPDYLSLREELGINTGMIARTLGALKRIDCDEHTWGEVLTISEQMQALAFDESLHNLAVTTESQKLVRLLNLTERLVRRVRAGYNSKRLHAEISSLMESRRKLVETDLKRIQVTKHNMPADQVFKMFENFVAMVLQIWSHDREKLTMFAAKVDELLGSATDSSELLKALTGGGREGTLDAVFEELDPKNYDAQETEEPEPNLLEDAIELEHYMAENNVNEYLEESVETGRLEINLEKMAESAPKFKKKLSF
jgi:hypothetical protein